MRHIAQFVDGPEDLISRFFRDVSLFVDDAGHRLHRNAGPFGHILQGGRQSYGLPFVTAEVKPSMLIALSDSAVRTVTESNDKVNRKSGRHETELSTE